MRLAAIQRDIQLQSGIIRGEEFNSIMEQAPRLAQAMAEGLGVTRGELRALAGEGKLTSEVVINAIQSQGEAIGKEFATLPNTVGNALQEAKNKIFLFIGEMDKSVNQSSKLAEAINLIGDSLDNLDPATVDAVNQIFNQLMTTLGIIWERIVNTYTGINDWIGVLTNTTGEATEQVGIITRTLQGVSIVLGAINDGFKTIAIAGDLVQSVTATWLAMMMRGLSKLTFGELAQSLTDFADRLDNQATKAFDSATNAAMSFESSAKAALDDAAMTAQDRLGAAAKAATDAYDSMKNDANASAEAQEGAFTEMATAQIAAYGESALAALQVEAAERGLKVAIDETGKAIIEKMSSEEQASTAAEQNAKALDKTYRELADTLGVGITQGYAEAKASVLELSDSFDVLTDSGYQTGDVLKAALTKMTEQAKNTTELQDIILMWEDLGEQGQLTGEDLAAGLDLANERLDALTDGVNSVNEAYKVLGLTTRAEAAKQAEAYTQAYGIIVKDGEATAGQLIDGFKKYAKAAVAANGDVVTAQLKTEAAQRGLTIAVDETGRVTFKSMSEAKESNDRVTRSVHGIRTAYDGISSSAGSAGNSMVRAANDASSAYDKLQAKIKAVKEAQAVADERTTMQNLRIYGKEEAPAIGDQFGTRLGVENFLKSQGLSEAQAIEEARKLYAKQGTSSGKLDFGTLQGFQEGQIMTTGDLDRFKSATVYLAEIAEKARQNDRQRDNYEAARTATAQITTQEYGRFDSQPRSIKTINVNLRLGGTSVPVQVAENQENALMSLLQQLQDSKAIAGY